LFDFAEEYAASIFRVSEFSAGGYLGNVSNICKGYKDVPAQVRLLALPFPSLLTPIG